MPRRAFTLLEIMVVLALLGLLAGATAWSMADDARRGAMNHTVKLLSHADAMARLAARNSEGRCALRFDLNARSLCRASVGDDYSEELSHSLALDGGWRVDCVLVAAERDADPPVREDYDIVELAFSRAGRSADYALRLINDDDAERGVWLAVAGLTGKVTLIEDEDELEKLPPFAPASRIDAH